MTLQDTIKNFREKHGLTMQEFASRCGLSKGYISMLENGKHPQSGRAIVPSIETYAKLARGMGVPLNELIGQTDPKARNNPSKANNQVAGEKINLKKRRTGMVKSNLKKVELYEDGDFEILITETKEQYGAWLSHKEYGVSEFMFGAWAADTTREGFLNLVENNLEEYKETYTADYIEGCISGCPVATEGEDE